MHTRLIIMLLTRDPTQANIVLLPFQLNFHLSSLVLSWSFLCYAINLLSLSAYLSDSYACSQLFFPMSCNKSSFPFS